MEGFGNIRQRLYRTRVEGVCAEVVGDGEAVDRGGRVVDDADDISQGVARRIGLVDRIFGDAEHPLDQADGDVGLDLSAVIAEGRYVRESCCHGFFLSLIFRRKRGYFRLFYHMLKEASGEQNQKNCGREKKSLAFFKEMW